MDQAQHYALLWRMRAGKGQRKRGGSGTEPKSRVGSSYLEEFIEAGRGFWWGAGRQAQVAENLDDDRGLFNGREDA